MDDSRLDLPWCRFGPPKEFRPWQDGAGPPGSPRRVRILRRIRRSPRA